MSLTEQFKEELAMLKSAPLTFAIGFTVLAGLIYWTEYSLIFKESLSRKDNLIDTLEKQLNTAKNHPQGEQVVPPSQQTSPSTGPATTLGDNSPANTGTIGTLSDQPR